MVPYFVSLSSHYYHCQTCKNGTDDGYIDKELSQSSLARARLGLGMICFMQDVGKINIGVAARYFPPSPLSNMKVVTGCESQMGSINRIYMQKYNFNFIKETE